MAAPSGIRSGVGFRNCVIFALNALGLPAATSPTVAYMGTRISGAKTLAITDPEPRRISHIGDDTIITIDVLPPNEAMYAELHAGKMNDVVDAILTGQLAASRGDIAIFGEGTDKRGYEYQVGILAYRQAQDTDPVSANFGLRGWEGRIMPKAIMFSRDIGYNDQPEDRVYTVVPAKVGSHLWGEAFTANVEGFLQAQMLRTFSYGKPAMASWKSAAGTEAVFTFPATQQARNTDYKAYKNGVEVTSNITKATTGVTFTSTAPAQYDIITAFYEEAL